MAKAKKSSEKSAKKAADAPCRGREAYGRLLKLWAEEKPRRYEFSLLRIEDDARACIALDDLQAAGWGWMALGGVAVKRGDAEGMSEAMEAALDLLPEGDPGHLTALVNYAEGWLSFQRLDLATVLLDKAHRIDPTDRRVLERLMETHLFQGHFHQARRLGEKLLALDPSRRSPFPPHGERIVRFLNEVGVEDADIAPMLHSVWERLNYEGVECCRVEASLNDWHVTVKFHLPLDQSKVDDIEELYVEQLMELDVPVRAVENVSLAFLPEPRFQRVERMREQCASA